MEEAGGGPCRSGGRPRRPCHTCRRIGAITVEDKEALAGEGRMAQVGLLGTVKQGTTSLPEALLKGVKLLDTPSPLEGEGGGEGVRASA